MLFSGFLDLPWWGLVLATLGLTHVTIAGVTIYLHRCQAHRALDLHPVVSHFFRFWLWLTTGMVTKEWAAIHRKHHAKCETVEDPHSPQIHGINRVLWAGVFLYVKEAYNKETLERYGHGTPDDWMERNLYTKHSMAGVSLALLLDMLVFGVVPGTLVWLVQIAWIPFWAAGVINGVGHWGGYRSFDTTDASKNIVPLGILIGGEELHNNHHAYPTSARLSSKWYEFDIGWLYIRTLEALGLANVKKAVSAPTLVAVKPVCEKTLQAVITHRYDVLANYAASLKSTYSQELERLRHWSPRDAEALRSMRRALLRVQRLSEHERLRLAEAVRSSGSRALTTMMAMRQELTSLWERSSASKEQLIRQLQDWCRRAEESGIAPLVDFSYRLRCYA